MADATPAPQPQPKLKKRLKVEPEESGRLEQLLVSYKKAKDAAAVASEAEDELKAGIKAYLLGMFSDGEGLPDAFDIAADPHGRYPGYTLALKGGFRLDTEVFKSEAPDIYVRYAKPIKPTWELRTQTSGHNRRRRP